MDQNNPGSRNYHSFVKGIASEGTYHPNLDDSKMAEIVDRIIDHVASQDLFGRCLQEPRGDQLFQRTMKQKKIVETMKKEPQRRLLIHDAHVTKIEQTLADVNGETDTRPQCTDDLDKRLER